MAAPRTLSVWKRADFALLRGAQQGERSAQVVSHGGEAYLQPRLGETEPSHPPQAVAPLPGAGPDESGHAVLHPDRVGGAWAAESAVAVDLARVVGQHPSQLGGVVHVGGVTSTSRTRPAPSSVATCAL